MTTKPKGLRLFDRAVGLQDHLKVVESDALAGMVRISATDLDADQLDKLAERCKQWSKYLRSQKGKRPVVKKWEDL